MVEASRLQDVTNNPNKARRFDAWYMKESKERRNPVKTPSPEEQQQDENQNAAEPPLANTMGDKQYDLDMGGADDMVEYEEPQDSVE